MTIEEFVTHYGEKELTKQRQKEYDDLDSMLSGSYHGLEPTSLRRYTDLKNTKGLLQENLNPSNAMLADLEQSPDEPGQF